MRKVLLVTALVAFGLWSAMPALAGSGSQCDAIAGNLVQNCGFETGDFTDWTVGGNTTNPGGFYYGVDGFDAHSGNFGAYMSEDLLAGSGAVTLSQTLATTVGQTYLVTFWLEQDTPPAAGYNHSFTALWGASTLLSLTPTTSNPGPVGTWTEYTFAVTASTASTLLEFEFINDDSYWSFDDVSVVQTPESSTALLAALALSAMYLLRRRLMPA
jgi:hypothetical protein